MKSLKESINTPHTQYAAPLGTNPVALQQQFLKIKEDIKHLQQTKRPNVSSTTPGICRSYQTMGDLVICRRCNQVGHFARACLTNLPPPRAPTRYQNHRHNYVPPSTSQHPRPLYTPYQHTPNQYSQRPSYRPTTNRYSNMGYPYPQNTINTNPSRRPPFPSTDRTDNKYQDRRSNIPGQHNNYQNVIQNHALQDQQCLVSGSLDDKLITILIDTGSSIGLLDE